MRFDRRSFLCGGSASALSAISGYPASAQTAEFEMPCVEWLAIRIVAVASRPAAPDKFELINNCQDGQTTSHRSSSSLPSRFQPEATIHVQSANGSDMRNFLIDPCADLSVLLEQMSRLRIEPSALDALVLSEGNPRATNALHDFLSATDRSLKKNLDVITGADALSSGPAESGYPFWAGHCRIVAEQSFVVGSAQNFPMPLHTGNASSLDFHVEFPRAAPPIKTISTSFVLLEKGLVIITPGNEDAANCVRAVQAASEIQDVHAIVGMNIGVNCGAEKTQKILSELLDFNPARIIVPADIDNTGCNVFDASISKKVVRCPTAARMVFRV